MSAFVGFVANPGDDASAAAVQAAEAQQPYGVPASVLAFVRSHEAGNNFGTPQETGYNSAGYGGFYGLPVDQLGSVQTQTANAAAILSNMYAQFGNWPDAISAYNVGPSGNLKASYGQQYGGGGGAPFGGVIGSAFSSATSALTSAGASDNTAKIVIAAGVAIFTILGLGVAGDLLGAE